MLRHKQLLVLVMVLAMMGMFSTPMPAYAVYTPDTAGYISNATQSPIVTFRSLQQALDWYTHIQDGLVLASMPDLGAKSIKVGHNPPVGVVNIYGDYMPFVGYTCLLTYTQIGDEKPHLTPYIVPEFRNLENDQLYLAMSRFVRVAGGKGLPVGTIGMLQAPPSGDEGLALYPVSDLEAFRAGMVRWEYIPTTLCAVPSERSWGMTESIQYPDGETIYTPTIAMDLDDTYIPSDDEIRVLQFTQNAGPLIWENLVVFNTQENSVKVQVKGE